MCPYPVASTVAAAGSSRPKLPPVEGTDFDPIAFIAANATAYWRMEDTEPVDSTGRGNNLSDPSELITDAPGKLGNACSFSAGDGTYLSRASTADLQIPAAGDFIVCCWMKPAAAAALGGIAAKGVDGDMEYHLTLNAGTLMFGLGTGDAVASSVPVLDGVWYFVAVRYTGSAIFIRVNAGAAEEVAASAQSATAQNFYIGQEPVNPAFFDGLIDDTLILKTSEPMSSEDFDALCSYLWSGGAGLDLTFIF